MLLVERSLCYILVPTVNERYTSKNSEIVMKVGKAIIIPLFADISADISSHIEEPPWGNVILKKTKQNIANGSKKV